VQVAPGHRNLQKYLGDKMREATNIIIEAKKILKSYRKNKAEHLIIKDLDIQIYENDFTVVMGASGSGKSTLIQLLSGMDKVSKGAVYFENNNLIQYSEKNMAEFRRKNCGYMFQQIHLISQINIMDNILITGLLTSKNKQEIIKNGNALLQSVGISEKEWSKYPNQLSGGQLARVGIARALINGPRVVFADEPTGSLDSQSGISVLDLLCQFHLDGQTIILVTHDLKSALRGNRIIYLKDGAIHGECNLGKYTCNSKMRKEKLLGFLEDMGW